MKPEDQTPHRHAHRYPGIRKRRVRKPLVELTPEPASSSSELKLRAPPDLQQKLREILAHGPVSLGKLRDPYGYDPVMLLRETIGKFSDTYVEADCDGHPGLALRENAPALSDSLGRQKLLEIIGTAGANGIYLSSLHRTSGFSSQHIQELLSELPGVECEVRNFRPLYRRKSDGAAEHEHVRESTLDELESVRDRLLQVLGTSQRMSNWLIDQCHFDHGTLSIVLAKYKDDFSVAEINMGVSSYLMISAVAGNGLHPPKPALLETPVSAEQSSSLPAPQANEPPALVSEVLGAEEADRLRWRPPSPGMGSRRGGRVMRDGRDRPRHPLVELP